MKTKKIVTQIGLVVVLLASTIELHATFPGKNGRIVFARKTPSVGGFALHTMNPDGTNVHQVTFVPSDFPEWSPDGTRIAFTYYDDDGAQIGIINADGSNFQALTSGHAIHEVPSWSPDQQHLVFDYSPTFPEEDPNFHTSLYIMNIDGSNPVQLTSGSFDVEPRFSPDGSQIVFVEIRKFTGKDQTGMASDPSGFQQEAVTIINSDGSNRRQLSAWGTAAEHPTWSPDGQWITYNDAAYKVDARFQPPTGSFLGLLGAPNTIYIIRADGGEGPRKVFVGTDRTAGVKPSFSPDGTKIVFACDNFRPEEYTEDICVMNRDGSNIVRITNSPRLENLPNWGTAPIEP